MSNFLHNAEEAARQLTSPLWIPYQAQWQICYRFHSVAATYYLSSTDG
ncbi:MAG TPA: hypothetical protein VGY91_08820 [Chthoniobacterales bacterium]|nr:hypothetical protein [Chthoniobacterales bacterium]